MTSGTAVEFDLSTLRDIYGADLDRISLAKKRQCDVWAHRTPDKWPIIFHAPLDDRQETIPTANLEEAFNDDELMLYSAVRGACGVANAKADGVPSIRANLGTGICMATLGLRQLVFPDKMPWLQEHLTLEQAAKLAPDDITVRGDFERGLGMMRLFKEVMGESLDIFCMDTQGPFDLAHLLLGDEIFYLPFDDPSLMHHVMEICLQIGIKTHTWMKEISGEPMTVLAHSNSIYAENMGIRICEDTTALIGRELMDEFAMPYTRRLAAHFGGAWVHYCGRNDHLTAAVCECPEVRGINFGIIPGRPHEHEFEKDMELIASSGKVYFGHWVPFDGESKRDWLKRIHAWSSRGALIEGSGNTCLGEGGFATVEDALEFWYAL